MRGELSEPQIDDLLFRHCVGRLGCHDGRRPYVVPVSYVYDGRSVYSYSADGLKLSALRADPLACFQVDEIDGLGDWRSVVAWGRFEELHDDAARDALGRLSARLRAFVETSAGMKGSGRSYVARAKRWGVMYRLVLIEKTGRFERS